MNYLLIFFVALMLVFWSFKKAGCEASSCGNSARINGEVVYDYSDCYDPADYYH